MAALTWPTGDNYWEINDLGGTRRQFLKFTVAIDDGDTISSSLGLVHYASFHPTGSTPITTSVEMAGTANRDLTVQLGASSTGVLEIVGT